MARFMRVTQVVLLFFHHPTFVMARFMRATQFRSSKKMGRPHEAGDDDVFNYRKQSNTTWVARTWRAMTRTFVVSTKRAALYPNAFS
jgi:hypothetical protein